MSMSVKDRGSATSEPVAPGSGMVWIPGGTFRMGSDRHYPEEAPVHRVTVDGFWIDRTPVTNREFRRFVVATGHVTFAERSLIPKDYPGALPHMLKAGSLVFTPPEHPVDLRDWSQWWNFTFGADWRRPYGRASRSRDSTTIRSSTLRTGCQAYAAWAGKELPTEAEWEFAARGGLDGAEFAWGDEFTPEDRQMANTWQGAFPHENTKADGYERTSPVTAFPPNGYGVRDMIGNVWEWTTDWYSRETRSRRRQALLHTRPIRAAVDRRTKLRSVPAQYRIPRKVLKGGSHLCAPNYCRRYRPAARHAQPVDTSPVTSGFAAWCGREAVVKQDPAPALLILAWAALVGMGIALLRRPIDRIARWWFARRQTVPSHLAQRIDASWNASPRNPTPTRSPSNCRRGAPACRSSARA